MAEPQRDRIGVCVTVTVAADREVVDLTVDGTGNLTLDPGVTLRVLGDSTIESDPGTSVLTMGADSTLRTHRGVIQRLTLAGAKGGDATVENVASILLMLLLYVLTRIDPWLLVGLVALVTLLLLGVLAYTIYRLWKLAKGIGRVVCYQQIDCFLLKLLLTAGQHLGI